MLITKQMEKFEILSTFFASTFPSKTVLEESQAPENRGEVWNMPDTPWKVKQVKESLNKLYIHKFMEHNRLDQPVLRKLHDATASPLLIIAEMSRQLGKIPEDWRQKNVTPILTNGRVKDPGYYRQGSFTTISGKIEEQLILEAIFPNR